MQQQEVQSSFAVSDSDRFRMNGKLLVLRYTRLGRLPPARYAAEILYENGYKVLVLEFGEGAKTTVTLDSSPPRLRYGTLDIPFIPKPLAIPVLVVSTFIKIMKQIQMQGKPKLVIAHGLYEESLALLLKLLLHVPFVIHVHDIYERKELTPINRIFWFVERFALRYANLLIFPEINRAKWMAKRYKLKTPYKILFNCPRLVRKTTPIDIRAKYHLPKDSFLLTYIGGIGPANCIAEVVEALQYVPSAYLFLWGWGDSKYIEKLRLCQKQLSLNERLFFAGILSDDTKWDTLAGFDASLAIYRPDTVRLRFQATASNKLFESMAVGVPVITTNHFTFSEIVMTHNIGVCIPEISAKAIADAIVKLMNDPLGRARMGKNGIKSHFAQFHYENQMENILGAI